MEPRSMLLEHTLVASGEIAEAGAVYAGWPARQLRVRKANRGAGVHGEASAMSSTANLHMPQQVPPPGYYGQ